METCPNPVKFMKTEVKRIAVIDTETGFAVVETENGKETVLQSFDLVQPVTAKMSLKEKAIVYHDALTSASNQAMSYLHSDLFKQYNEMVGFEHYTPQFTSQTEFIVYKEAEGEEEILSAENLPIAE
jgi:hypothetical protein